MIQQAARHKCAGRGMPCWEVLDWQSQQWLYWPLNVSHKWSIITIILVLTTWYWPLNLTDSFQQCLIPDIETRHSFFAQAGLHVRRCRVVLVCELPFWHRWVDYCFGLCSMYQFRQRCNFGNDEEHLAATHESSTDSLFNLLGCRNGWEHPYIISLKLTNLGCSPTLPSKIRQKMAMSQAVPSVKPAIQQHCCADHEGRSHFGRKQR